MGIQDMLYQLDADGKLAAEKERDGETDIDGTDFERDFYTVPELESELGI